jgi:pilus assembly protein CpaB
MQQTRSRTLVVAGVAVALIGAIAVFAYAKGVTGRVAGEPGVPAFVASRDIPAGTKWEDASSGLTKRNVPASLRPASYVSSPEQLTGRTSVRAIAKGEVLTKSHFGKSASAPAAGLQIPPGHNAVTMNMGTPQGVAHYVQAGDLVNIYVTIKGTPAAPTITKLLLPNVQVLANRSATAQERAGSAASATSSGEMLLTLALTPDQAEKTIFSRENGSLWFGLVHPGDAPAATGGRTAATVLN